MSSEVLTNCEINRYSRHIILSNVGYKGQVKLRGSSVLIVGAGGLGCPCALYLAGSGVGHIGLVDYDQVELNNIHRQIIHTEGNIGRNKVDSAKAALQGINSNITVSTYCVEINCRNALEIVKKFDIVVDASDNVATRYLLNDAAFLCGKPLVSGSALQMEGQLTVYNHDGSCCYRCLFPDPPSPETVTSCGESGVLSVIPGTIGVLQALQVLNLLLERTTLAGFMLLFDGNDCTFRRVKLRGKSPRCSLCGENPTITELLDYESFCQAKANDKNPDLHLLASNQRVTAEEYKKLLLTPHLLIDVRAKTEFAICHLPEALNIPIRTIKSATTIETISDKLRSLNSTNATVYVVCRRGNDSQKAVIALESALTGYTIKDIVGGLHAWAREVDSTFPVY